MMTGSHHVQFSSSEAPLPAGAIAAIEEELGFQLPGGLRSTYLRSNGGVPVPYVYEDDHLDTVVCVFLPLRSTTGQRTVLDSYRDLVLSKRIAPKRHIPFALDGGGDFFFVDCSTPDGLVSFYRSDSAKESDRLLALSVGIEDFWSRLSHE